MTRTAIAALALAALNDADVALAGRIIEARQAEIDQMRAMLRS